MYRNLALISNIAAALALTAICIKYWRAHSNLKRMMELSMERSKIISEMGFRAVATADKNKEAINSLIETFDKDNYKLEALSSGTNIMFGDLRDRVISLEDKIGIVAHVTDANFKTSIQNEAEIHDMNIAIDEDKNSMGSRKRGKKNKKGK